MSRKGGKRSRRGSSDGAEGRRSAKPSKRQRRSATAPGPDGGSGSARGGADPAGGPSIGLGLAALLFAALSLVYFLPALLPRAHLYGSDYYAASYFYMEWLSDEFARGAIPKWLPYVYGGLPWFANPGATWYPPRLLGDLFLPAYKLFAFMYFVQIAVAGVGGFLLFRELRCRPWVSLVAALSFQFTGLLLSFVLAGHDGRMIVASFAPLAFFFLHRGIRTGGLGAFAGVAATYGLCMLSNQIQSVYYLLLAGALWSIFALWHHGHLSRSAGSPRPLVRRLALGLGAIALAFAMTAVNYLPFLGYIDASPRGGGGRGYEYAVSWSMPPGELVSLAVPEQNGIREAYRADVPGANPFKLHTEYVGAFALILLVLGAFYARRDRRWWFFAALTAFALTISLGGHTPLYRLYYEALPGTKLFRAPSLSFFLIAFALTAMAALTLERLAELRGSDAQARERAGPGAAATGPSSKAASPLLRARWIALSVAGLALLGAAVAPGLESAGANAARGWLRFATFAAAVGGTLWLWLGGKARTTVAAALLAVAIVADLWIIDRKFYDITEPPAVTFRADGVASFLQAQAGQSRVWVLPPLPQLPAYHGQSNYLMKFGVPQITGEHGNQLQRWNQYLGADSNSYTNQQNVLGELGRFAQSGGVSPLPLLNGAAVGWIVARANVGLPLPVAYEDASGTVYQNPNALPRAYLVPNAEVVDAEATLDAILSPAWNPATTAVLDERPAPFPEGPPGPAGEVLILEQTSDRFLLRADAERPAILVLAENHYPDWKVRVDGEDAALLRVNHSLMGVALDAGEHSVEFAFRSADLTRGLWISLGAWLVLLAGIAWAVVSTRRAARVRDGEEAPSPA